MPTASGWQRLPHRISALPNEKFGTTSAAPESEWLGPSRQPKPRAQPLLMSVRAPSGALHPS